MLNLYSYPFRGRPFLNGVLQGVAFIGAVFVFVLLILLLGSAFAEASTCISKKAALAAYPDSYIAYSGRVEGHKGQRCWYAPGEEKLTANIIDKVKSTIGLRNNYAAESETDSTSARKRTVRHRTVSISPHPTVTDGVGIRDQGRDVGESSRSRQDARPALLDHDVTFPMLFSSLVTSDWVFDWSDLFSARINFKP